MWREDDKGYIEKKVLRELRVYRALAFKYIDACRLSVLLLPYFPTVWGQEYLSFIFIH